jgi:hypothetical protein
MSEAAERNALELARSAFDLAMSMGASRALQALTVSG